MAAVTPRKGQHRLVEALAAVTDLPWSCVCVGGLEQDPEYVSDLRALIAKHGLEDRLHLAGPQAGAQLDASYAAADLMVLTSYAETYGMAVTEALARGIPVLATDVGGLPEAVGRAPDGGVPGILVPPENPAALAAELRGWFGEADVRRRLKAAARGRRAALDGWAGHGTKPGRSTGPDPLGTSEGGMKRAMTMPTAGQPGLVVLLVATDAEAAAVQARREVALLRRALLPGVEEADVSNATTRPSTGSKVLRDDDVESAVARAHRVAALRSAVGVRGRIPSGTSPGSVASVDADTELSAARGRRVAALRSLVGMSERAPGRARSAA